VDKAEAKLQEVGLETKKFRSSSIAKSKKRRRSTGGLTAAEEAGEDGSRSQSAGRSKSASGRSKSASGRSRSRTPSVKPGSNTSFSNPKQKAKASKMAKTAQRERNQDARQGESDRRFLQKKPKHLFSGKRGVGKTDRR